MKTLLIISTLVFSIGLQAKIVEIFNTQNQQSITLDELVAYTPRMGHFILGEFHNNPGIQNAQAQLIAAKVDYENSHDDFTLYWEFLNHTEQSKTQNEFNRFLNDEISAMQFLTNTAGAQNHSYAPLITTLKKLGGKIKGINLPRSIKRQVRTQGIQSVDPSLIPTSHYVGGQEYLERFSAVMGNHVPANQMQKYFLVQCLTDSVMAEQIALEASSQQLNFTVAGSFHTDFKDATVVRLSKLSQNPIITFKFVNGMEFTNEEIANFKAKNHKYGYFADYIIIAK